MAQAITSNRFVSASEARSTTAIAIQRSASLILAGEDAYALTARNRAARELAGVDPT